jgi:iron complex outermembrane receptor protein
MDTQRTTRLLLLMGLLVMMLPLGAIAQTITGRVSSEGTPLVGATVLVRGTTIGTSTDANGRYMLRLSPGTHEVVFSFVGYTPRTITVTLAENEQRTLNVELQATAVTTDIVVVVGTRAAARTVTDSPLPIDVLSAQELVNTGQTTFDKMLQHRVPSFSVSQTPVNDATALLDPWEIRNMGVSRTLILINGKRKNLSSLVYIQTSPSRGETATDISAIPVDAIKRVEILRDGASAQYGSDALAGVVNIVLKDNTEGGYVSVNTGVTSKGDGGRFSVAMNNGSSIFGEKGFANYTVELSRVNEARRSGVVDAEQEFQDFGDPARGYDLNYIRRFLATDKYAGNRNSAPATTAAKFALNSGVQISDNTDLYLNGAYVYKKVNSFANYRVPYWRTYSDYPYLASFFGNGDSASYRGYLPTFDGDLVDYNATLGFRSKLQGWGVDASLTIGFNSQDYTVLNSHNRSDIRDANGEYVYRQNSPINFKPGGTAFTHFVWNLDLSRAVTDKLNVAIGSEFRSEVFEITPGDKASWDGVGADSFAGIRPEDSGTFTRYNFGGYFDVSYDVTSAFLLNGTVRNEYYSDFGNAFVYKVSSRYKLWEDRMTLRGSYSTGFKAPTLHQIYTQRVQYSFVPGKGIQSIGLVNNVSPQARLLGVGKLKPEESKNLTLGIGARLTPDLSITLDYYNIAISDRIVISNRVPFAGGESEFFTNSISTKTAGLDIVVDYKNINIGSGTAAFSLAGNVNLKNERDGAIPTRRGVPVIDQTQEALFFTSRPKQKFVLGVNYGMERFGLLLNNTYFGPTEFRQNGLDPNLKTVFQPKVVTDIGVSYKIVDNLSLSANVNNVFDVLPEWKFEALNPAGQAILNDPAQARRQWGLVTFNGRYSIMTYDGFHFSQLGRIYNVGLTYTF